MSRSRSLIIAAVAAAILYVVGGIAVGSPPGSGDPGTRVVAWFDDHRDAARLYAWTSTFGALAIAVVAGLIREVLPGPAGRVFMLGAAAFIVETAVQAWLWAALALHPGSLEPATARLVFDIANFWGPVLTGATMTMIGAVTVLGIGVAPAIPRWLFILGVVTFLEQAIETVTVFGTHGFTAPGGDMNLLLGAGLTLVWLAGLVVWAAGRPALEPAAQE